MLKKTILASFFAISSLILISWGSQGHKIISGYAFLSFNEEMNQFTGWKSFLVDHASDPDNRRNSDPSEGPKHYIDIDNYPEFVTNGSIAQSPDTIVKQHGQSFVIDNGILPWATITTYDSLVACFERRDWNKAKIFAADLGHYVADGYMPLHITKNYDGQLSGNKGIHSRYESSMINTYYGEITYAGGELNTIPNVSEYVFAYLYRNYPYVDSIMLADDVARAINSNTSSTQYKASLWNSTKVYTTRLFKEASFSLSELFYSAWVEAGKPLISGGNYYPDLSMSPEKLNLQISNIFPNPFINETFIRFSLEKQTNVKLEVKDSCGRTVSTLLSANTVPGEHNFSWKPDSFGPGIYFVSFKTPDQQILRKVVRTL